MMDLGDFDLVNPDALKSWGDELDSSELVAELGDDLFDGVDLDFNEEKNGDAGANEPKTDANNNATSDSSKPPTNAPAAATTGNAPSTGRQNSSNTAAPRTTGGAPQNMRRASSASSTKKGGTAKSRKKNAKEAASKTTKGTGKRKNAAANTTLPPDQVKAITDLKAIMAARKMTMAVASSTMGVANNPLQKWVNGRAANWGPRSKVEKWLAKPEQQATLAQLQGGNNQSKPPAKAPTKAQQAKLNRQQSNQKNQVSRQNSTQSRGSAQTAKQRQRAPASNARSQSQQNLQTGAAPSRQPSSGSAAARGRGRAVPANQRNAPQNPNQPGYYGMPPQQGRGQVKNDPMARQDPRQQGRQDARYDPLPVNPRDPRAGAYGGQNRGYVGPPGRGGMPPHHGMPGQQPMGHQRPVGQNGPGFGGISAGIQRFTETLKRTTNAELHQDIDQAVHNFIHSNQQIMNMSGNSADLTRIRSKQSKMLLTRLQAICGEESIKAATDELKNLKGQRHGGGHPGGAGRGGPGGHMMGRHPQAGHAGMQPNQPDRHRQVASQYARLIKAWNHACSCNNPQCSHPFCIKIKPSVQHQRDLKNLKASGQQTRCPADCKDCGLYNKLCNFSYNQRQKSARQQPPGGGAYRGHHPNQMPPGPGGAYRGPGGHYNDPRYQPHGYPPGGVDMKAQGQRPGGQQKMSPLPYNATKKEPGGGRSGDMESGDHDIAKYFGDMSGAGGGAGSQNNKRKAGDTVSGGAKKRMTKGPTDSSGAPLMAEEADDWKNIANMFGSPSSPAKREGAGSSPAGPGQQKAAQMGMPPQHANRGQSGSRGRQNPGTATGKNGKPGAGDRVTCVICQDADREILFLPCAHICTCGTCGNSSKITACPICRKSIERKSFVYLS